MAGDSAREKFKVELQKEFWDLDKKIKAHEAKIKPLAAEWNEKSNTVWPPDCAERTAVREKLKALRSDEPFRDMCKERTELVRLLDRDTGPPPA